VNKFFGMDKGLWSNESLQFGNSTICAKEQTTHCNINKTICF